MLPKLYGDQEARQGHWAQVQASRQRWGTELGAGGRWPAWACGATGAQAGTWADARGAAGPRQAGAVGARGTGAVHAHARPGRATRPVGCALSALSLF